MQVAWTANTDTIASLVGPRTKHIPILEDLDSGEYIMAVFETYEFEAKREPGISIAGRPFVGNVLLIRGYEVGPLPQYR